MVDSDGKTHLDKPYCALQKECFGGIVGAKSPYADGLGLMGGWSLALTQPIFKMRCVSVGVDVAFRNFGLVVVFCKNLSLF